MEEQVIKYIKKLSTFIPEFERYWNSNEACFNCGEQSTIYGVFSDFSHLVIEQLKNDKLSNAEQLFSFIETILHSGGDVANAVCTCFLENILNQTPNDIDPKKFVPFLGEKSKEFCIGWDKFTGIYTEGLH